MGNEGSAPLKYGEKLENDVNVTWKKSDAKNVPAGRDGHCSCGVENKAFIFGGVMPSADGESVESNEMLIFDLESESWSVAPSNGDVPPPRSAATMTAVGGTIFLFGGLSQNSGWFEDVHAFDTSNNTWRKITTEGKGPSSRDKLASSTIGQNVYIFGGFGPQLMPEELSEDDEEYEDEDDEGLAGQQGAEFGWFNDLYIFDTEKNSFSSPMQMNLGVPTARAAHAMCAVENYLVIFGGKDAEARKNDLHIYDTVSRKWTMDLDKAISGCQPEPRSFHTMTAVGHRLVVMGGRGVSNQHFSDVHIFDTKTREWLQPSLEGAVYGERGVHSACVAGDSLMIYGGSAQFSPETMQCMKYHSDVYLCKTADVSTGKAVPKDNQENVPLDNNVPNLKEQGLATANANMETAN